MYFGWFFLVLVVVIDAVDAVVFFVVDAVDVVGGGVVAVDVGFFCDGD